MNVAATYVNTVIGCIYSSGLYPFILRPVFLIGHLAVKLPKWLPTGAVCVSTVGSRLTPAEKVKWFTGSHVQQCGDTRESPALAEAAALSAPGRGSGPFRAMFTEARHRPFVMVSMCVCKRACAGGGGTTEKWSHLGSCRSSSGLSPLAHNNVPVGDFGVSVMQEHLGFP